jgi:hypothetical protein
MGSITHINDLGDVVLWPIFDDLNGLRPILVLVCRRWRDICVRRGMKAHTAAELAKKGYTEIILWDEVRLRRRWAPILRAAHQSGGSDRLIRTCAKWRGNYWNAHKEMPRRLAEVGVTGLTVGRDPFDWFWPTRLIQLAESKAAKLVSNDWLQQTARLLGIAPDGSDVTEPSQAQNLRRFSGADKRRRDRTVSNALTYAHRQADKMSKVSEKAVNLIWDQSIAPKCVDTRLRLQECILELREYYISILGALLVEEKERRLMEYLRELQNKRTNSRREGPIFFPYQRIALAAQLSQCAL